MATLSYFDSFSQQLFYSDIHQGGVTGTGFSTGGGSGTVSSIIQIPPNSTIKKAYLIATTDSTPPITVVLNGNNYTFNDSHIITNGFISLRFNSGFTKSNSSIRAMDITSDIDSSISNYSMIIPPPTQWHL